MGKSTAAPKKRMLNRTKQEENGKSEDKEPKDDVSEGEEVGSENGSEVGNKSTSSTSAKNTKSNKDDEESSDLDEKSAKKGRGRPKSKADGSDSEDEEPAAKKGRGRPKPKAEESGSDGEEPVAKKGRAKPKSKADDSGSEAEEPAPRKGRGRSNAKAKPDESGSDDEPAPKKGRGRSKAKADGEDEPAKKGRGGRPKSKGKKNADSENEEDEEPTTKKGRGQSKKIEQDKSDESEEESASKKVDADDDLDAEEPAQKRGRPKTAKKKGGKAAKKGKKPPAKPSAPEKDADGSESEDETEYEVDKILEVQFLKGGKREFLIKWKGFSKGEATWEPEENLQCAEIVDAFMAKLENDDLPRSRRLSSRPSTMRLTRMSEARLTELHMRVKEGRVDKYDRRNGLHEAKLLGELPNIEEINGGTLKKVQGKIESKRKRARRLTYRGVARAAFLSCGMAVSLGVALLLSSNDSLSWDVPPRVYELIQNLQDKIRQSILGIV